MSATMTPAATRIIQLATHLGLRPEIHAPAANVIRVILNGKGRDAGFGCITIGVRTGKVIRMELRLGNDDNRPRRYVTHTGYLRTLHALRDSYALYARCLEPEPAPPAMVVTSGTAVWRAA